MTLRETIEKGKFIITCELAPPKGTDVSNLTQIANSLTKLVDAVNLTDGQGGNMRMCPLACASHLINLGIDIIWQLTCRDRNRIALQADCLGAWSIGIKNVLAMRGDDPQSGDHPDAKPVFDLDTTLLVKVINKLNHGFDMSGAELKGKSNFFIGCPAHPAVPDLMKQKETLQARFDEGAGFIQTQICYETDQIKRFLDSLGSLITKTIVGVTPLKSLKMATFMNEKVKGVSIPLDILKRIEDAHDQKQEGLIIAKEIISELKKAGACGVHIMAVGQENILPEIIKILI